MRRLLAPVVALGLACTAASAESAPTDAKLVDALVEARWGVENSRPTNCRTSEDLALMKQQTRRYRVLRRASGRVVHGAVLRAVDKRWAAEKAEWDRKTATMDVWIPCAAGKLRAANARVSQLLRVRGVRAAD